MVDQEIAKLFISELPRLINDAEVARKTAEGAKVALIEVMHAFDDFSDPEQHAAKRTVNDYLSAPTFPAQFRSTNHRRGLEAGARGIEERRQCAIAELKPGEPVASEKAKEALKIAQENREWLVSLDERLWAEKLIATPDYSRFYYVHDFNFPR